MSSSLLNRYLTGVVVAGVAAIALLSFVLSYQVLWDEAERAGVYTPYLFPLVVDAGIVVFIIVRLYATLNGIEQAERWAQVAIVAATITSIILNVAHAVDFGAWIWSVNAVIGVVYFVISPASLATCAELLSMILKHMAEVEPLTEQQQAAVDWLAGEISNDEFAKLINMSPKTLAGWRRKMEV